MGVVVRVEKGEAWLRVGGMGRRCKQRDGKVWEWMSKVKGEAGTEACLVAARRESRTSRRASSRARAVSEEVVEEVVDWGSGWAKVLKLRFLRLVPGEAEEVVGVLGRWWEWEWVLRTVGSVMTPVDCQLRLLRRPWMPPGGTAFSSSWMLALVWEAKTGWDWATGEVREEVSLWWSLSFLLLRAVRRVIPPRSLRISSTLWMPSGFFLEMN
jgi:hypothetical protein